MSTELFITILLSSIGVIVTSILAIFPNRKDIAIGMIIISVIVIVAAASYYVYNKGVTVGENKKKTENIEKTKTIEPITETKGKDGPSTEDLSKVVDFFSLETYSQDTENIRKDNTYQKSNTGKQYTESMYYAYSWAFDDNGTSSQIYFLDKQYETFSGTLFLPYESRSVTSPTYPSVFKIYVDDTLEYEAPVFLSGQNPVDFSIDVSACTYLEIKMGGGWYVGDGSGLIPLVCLTNAEIIKK